MPLKFIRRINHSKRVDSIGNILGLLLALIFLYGRCNYTFYFYRQNQVQLSPAVLLGSLLLALMVWNLRKEGYWRDWKRVPGIALCLAVLVFVPVGVWAVQWCSTFQPKETTTGTIIEKGGFGIWRRYSRYSGLLIGVRTKGGAVKRFDFTWYRDQFNHAKVGQPVTITHYTLIRDEYLDIQLE